MSQLFKSSRPAEQSREAAPDSFRSRFAHTKRGILYLNHAAQSPLPGTTIEAINEHLSERHDGMLMSFPKDQVVIRRCRSRIAELLGLPNPRNIAFTGNTTEGLNRVTSGLDWRKGDEIILSSIEFPANVYPFRKLQSRGVTCRVVDSSDGTVPIDRISEAITLNTRMITISAVQFLSGYRADLNTIGELCRQHDLWFVVDGIQAAGVIPMNLHDLGVDAFSCGGQKWLMAPTGIGFLCLSEKLCKVLQTPDPGWLSVEDPWDLFRYDQPLKADAGRYEGGVLNTPGIYGLNASLGLLLETGIEQIWSQVQAATGRLREGLMDIGLKPFTTDEAEYRSGIETFHIPGNTDSESLEKMFRNHDIFLTIRNGKIRFSPHGYNTVDEIDRVIDITRTIFAGL